MKTVPDLSLRAAFEQAAGVPIVWTDELQELAVGYFSTLTLAMEDDNPLTVHELTAMAVSLSSFASAVAWISDAANDGLKSNAHAVRRTALRKWNGQVVAIPMRNSAEPAASPTHH
ncbi:hypothetical protein [Cupriavidus sp. BIC8F]|uniref:hypothetical protein n=1 Tax=Cupriavidus sp. BIC8F TaxID=3079014 RepID=UPI0029167A75|nr:hypothetical protein [Cupriavidus sp. BIC8F]